MYKLKTNSNFDGAHFLAEYDGKCRNIHGHRWIVEVVVKDEKLVAEGQMRGMVVDFSNLKNSLKELTDRFDHSLIVEKGTLKAATMTALAAEEFRVIEMDFRPTAENFSKYFYDEMKKQGYDVLEATVYETPTNAATYTED